MKKMKTRIMTAAACMAMSATLLACGSKEEPAADAAVETAAEAEAEAAPTEEAAPPVTADELGNGHTNTLAVVGPSYTGLSNIMNENNDDGTYHYEDMTEDGVTKIINLCTMNYQRDGQDMDAYAENYVCAQVDSDAKITGSKQDDALTASLTYPVYEVDWESGSNEDTKQAVGVVIMTDWFTYFYGFQCPIDSYEENKDFYAEELQRLELIDVGEPTATQGAEGAADTKTSAAASSFEGTARLYVEQIEKLLDAGDADQFALVDVDGDGVSELAASSSEGSWDKDQIYLYTPYNDEMVLLTSDIGTGMEGHYIGFYEGENLIDKSGAAMGSRDEYYEIKDGKLVPVLSLAWYPNPENNDELEYMVDDKVTTSAEYFKTEEEVLSSHGDLTILETPEMKVVSVSSKDGTREYKEKKKIPYKTILEIEDELR